MNGGVGDRRWKAEKSGHVDGLAGGIEPATSPCNSSAQKALPLPQALTGKRPITPNALIPAALRATIWAGHRLGSFNNFVHIHRERREIFFKHS